MPICQAGNMDKFVCLTLAFMAGMMQHHLVHGQGFTSCTYNFNCTADTNLGVIDLNKASKGSPYQSSDPATTNVYLWDPCSDFNLIGVPAGALQQAPGDYNTVIGVHNLSSCDTTTDGFLRFNMKTEAYWFTFVKCICGDGNTLLFESQNPVSNIHLNFTSVACCPPGYSPSSVTTAISPGSVLLIIFFTAVLVYLMLGTIYQSAVRKSQGRDRIPNMAVWSIVPGLIQDGFIFTFTCGRRSGYDEV